MVAEDWAAVSDAIKNRLTELSMSQRKLITKSGVSKAVVGEIQNNTVQRRRSERTLSAISVALDWHPLHLSAVLTGLTPPRAGDPLVSSSDDVPGRLSLIENELRLINDHLARIDTSHHRLDEVATGIMDAVGRIMKAVQS